MGNTAFESQSLVLQITSQSQHSVHPPTSHTPHPIPHTPPHSLLRIRHFLQLVQLHLPVLGVRLHVLLHDRIIPDQRRRSAEVPLIDLLRSLVHRGVRRQCTRELRRGVR